MIITKATQQRALTCACLAAKQDQTADPVGSHAVEGVVEGSQLLTPL
jgi:hypothetical protein